MKQAAALRPYHLFLKIAERRRTALVALRREISGDLNWIVS
jgi:hypothetical protein